MQFTINIQSTKTTTPTGDLLKEVSKQVSDALTNRVTAVRLSSAEIGQEMKLIDDRDLLIIITKTSY